MTRSTAPEKIKTVPRNSPLFAADGAGPLDAPSRPFGGVGHLARSLFTYAPRRTILALLLMLATGVTEGLGIALIIPLLHVAGFAGEPGAGGFVAAATARAADLTGVALTVPVVLVSFLALAVVRVATVWQREVLQTEISLGFVDRCREQLHAAVAGARWEFLLGRRRSDVEHVLIGDVTRRIRMAAWSLMRMTVALALALAQLGLAVLLSPLVSGVALLAGGALLVLTRPLVRRVRALGEQSTRATRTLHASLTDFMAGLRLAKSHDAEEPHVRHFTATAATARRHEVAFVSTRSVARAALDLGASVILAVTVWLAVSHAALTPPELMILALIFVRVVPVLVGLQQETHNLVTRLPAYTHARQVQRSLREAAEAPAGASAARMELRGALTARRVSFAYANDTTGAAAEEPALTGIDLDIPARQLTAIAGPSGAGKSTLANLLLGLIEPGGGEVCVDSVPLTGSTVRCWRRSVAYVPQDPYLFHDTIRANLLWGRRTATEAEMWQALRRAAAEEFVAALPRGLDTVAGDRGDQLSGGERQRVALARALIREPALLVIDEGTSQLDAEHERQVLTALRSLRGRLTIVVIAHRTAVLESADRIVVLKSGRVAATGTWRELDALKDTPGDRLSCAKAERA